MTPARRLLPWGVLVLLGTLHPFTIEPGPVVVPSETFWLPRLKGFDPPFNVLMFLPLGWAVRAGRGRVWQAALLSLLFSGLIELLQHFVCFRVPVAEDLVFNTLGGVLGFFGGGGLTRLAARLDRGLVRALGFGAIAAFVVWSAAPPTVTARLWGWAPRAELIVGREQPGNYRWPGEVRSARVWVGTSSAAAPDWDWRRDGEGRFEAMAERVVAAQAFLLQVDMQGADVPADYDDAARIVAWSSGVQRRNLMLGQVGDRYVVRVRTRVTPIVGILPDRAEPLTLAAVPAGEAAQVTVRFDRGVLSGRSVGPEVRGVLSDLPNHNGVRTFLLPRQAWGAWLYGLSAGLVGAWAWAGYLRRRLAFGAGLGLVLVTEGLQIAQFGRGPSVDVILFGVLGAAVSVLGAHDGRGDAGED